MRGTFQTLASLLLSLWAGCYLGFTQCGGVGGTQQAFAWLALIFYLGCIFWLYRIKSTILLIFLLVILSPLLYIAGLGIGWAWYAGTPESSWLSDFLYGVNHQNC